MTGIIKKLYGDHKARLKSDKIRLVLYLLYIALTLTVSVISFAQGNVRNGILPHAYAALFFVVLSIVESYCSIRCGKVFLVIVFLVPVGGMLGTCLDFYNLIPVLDTVLHTISGFIFASLGYVIMERVLHRQDTASKVACVMFGIAFSLALAVLWELFEWGITVITNGDMLEDSIVRDIRSYFLSGSHNVSVDLLDIEKTVVYYDGGKMYVIEGGYLDLGGIDTLTDMLVCTVGAALFAVLSAVLIGRNESAFRLFVPVCTSENDGK